MTGGVKVEQCDRDAALALLTIGNCKVTWTKAEDIQGGERDDHEYVQAFACHRLSTSAVESEREACAKLAIRYADDADRAISQSRNGPCKTSVMGEAIAGRSIATAIRARDKR